MTKFSDAVYRLITGWTRIGPDTRIKRIGRDEIKYCESDRFVTIQTELLTGPVHRHIYTSTIEQWDPPHEAEAISHAERVRIAQVVRAHLESVGTRTSMDP